MSRKRGKNGYGYVKFISIHDERTNINPPIKSIFSFKEEKKANSSFNWIKISLQYLIFDAIENLSTLIPKLFLFSIYIDYSRYDLNDQLIVETRKEKYFHSFLSLFDLNT